MKTPASRFCGDVGSASRSWTRKGPLAGRSARAGTVCAAAGAYHAAARGSLPCPGAARPVGTHPAGTPARRSADAAAVAPSPA